MDNQQVDIAWFAGLFDGEGCVSLGKISYGKRDGQYYHPQAILTNTNVNLMNAAANVLRKAGLPFYIRTYASGRKNTKPLVTIQIQGIFRCLRFYEWLLPYMVGKRQEAELMLEYLRSRLTQPGRKAPYTAREHEIFGLLATKKRDVHSRDLEPSGGFLGPLEDIVQSSGKSVR